MRELVVIWGRENPPGVRIISDEVCNWMYLIVAKPAYVQPGLPTLTPIGVASSPELALEHGCRWLRRCHIGGGEVRTILVVNDSFARLVSNQGELRRSWSELDSLVEPEHRIRRVSREGVVI